MSICNDIPLVRRFAVWRGWKSCYICKKPITFSEAEIDHLVPKYLSKDTKKLQEELKKLGLPRDFDLLGVENLRPCCSACNKRKGKRILRSLEMQITLQATLMKTPKIREIEQKYYKRMNEQKCLGVIQIWLNEGTLSYKALRSLRRQEIARQIPSMTSSCPIFRGYDLVNLLNASAQHAAKNLTLVMPESPIQNDPVTTSPARL